MMFLDDFDDYDDLLEDVDILNLLEPITEDTILIDRKNNFSIHTNSDRDKHTGNGAGYFKWVNSTSFGKADEIARIKFDSPDYEYHSTLGKDTVNLSREEKKNMIKLLEKPITQEMKNDIKNNELKEKINTGYDYLKYMHNIHNGFNDEDMLGLTDLGDKKLEMIDMDSPMPDYTKLPSVKRKDRSKKKGKK